MKKRNIIRRLGALVVAAVLTLGMNLPAAAENDTIDSSKQGSLTIYKYDYRAAVNGKALTDANYKEGTGEKDEAFETSMAGYGIKGVQFKAVKVADVLTYTRESAENGASAVAAGVEVVYAVDGALADIVGLQDADAVQVDGKNCWTSDQINKALGAKIAENADNTAVKNQLEQYVGTTASRPYLLSETDEKGMAMQEGLATGLYAVIEVKVPDQVMTTTDPFFVSIPTTTADGESWNYDVVVYPKNQTDYATLVKKVREHQKDNAANEYSDTVSASIGDTVDYRIVSRLPKISSEATYLTKYIYVDTLSDGQDYQNDLSIGFYAASETASATDAELAAPKVTFVKDQDYTVTLDETKKVITVAMTDAGLKKINEGAAGSSNTTDGGSNGDYSYMVVSYSAVLNEDAILGDAGNYNDVKLQYSRTNENYFETLEDKTIIYAFGLDVKKTHQGSKTFDAAKVQFTLYNENTNEKENGYYVTAKPTADAGHYIVTGQAAKAGEKPTTDKDNTIFSPNSDGKLYIEGLEADTYALTEIKTSDGYSLLKDAIKIEITSKEKIIDPTTLGYEGNDQKGNTVGNVVTTVIEKDVTGKESSSAVVNGKKASMEQDGSVTGITSENAEVVLEIVNTQGFNLPKTGGSGVWLLTILGILAGALGIYFLIPKKKEKK